jgi:hypothetical protein
VTTTKEKLRVLRIKFDSLLIAEVNAFGGIPSYAGRCGLERQELHAAIADVLAENEATSELELAACAVKKLLPPALMIEVLTYLDPLGTFETALREPVVKS